MFENIRKTEAGVVGWSEVGMNLKEWIKDEQWRTLIILFTQKQLNILSLFEYPQLSDEKELGLRMTFPNPHPVAFVGVKLTKKGTCQRMVALPYFCWHSRKVLPFPPLQHPSVLCNEINSLIQKIWYSPLLGKLSQGRSHRLTTNWVQQSV